jgi:hypothetical protein
VNASLRIGLVIVAATLLWSSLAGAEDDAGNLDAISPPSDADSGSAGYEDGGFNSASEDVASVSYQDPGFEEGLSWDGGCQDGTGDAGTDGSKEGDSSTDEETVASSGSIGCSLSSKPSSDGCGVLGLVGVASLRRRRARLTRSA